MPFRELEKNSRETVRVTPGTYEGHDLIDIRVYARDKAGETVPTRKGISINVDAVPELLEALIWALGQPCDAGPDVPEAQLSTTDAEQLAKDAWEILHTHGSPVHWDSAERMVLSGGGYSKWDLHFVLVTRKDLFERTGRGCYRARKGN